MVERLDELRRAYAAALLLGDEIAAERTIRDALGASLTAAQIDEEIIGPAQWLVGEMWQRGEITVADEHIATEISIRVLTLQREARRVIAGRPVRRVLLATPAGEAHDVALRMVANLLHDAGYGVVMLGADVPAPELAVTAARLEPDVICMSATMEGEEDQLLLAIHAIQERWPSAGFVLGGRGLSSRLRRHAGVDVCAQVSDAVEAVDAMIQRGDLN